MGSSLVDTLIEVTEESGRCSDSGDVSKGKPPAVAVCKMILAKQWPYSCSPCNKYFVSDTALGKHMKKHLITKSDKDLNRPSIKNKPSRSKPQLAEKNKCKSNQVKSCKSSNHLKEDSQKTNKIELAQVNIGTSDCAHIEKEENVKVNKGGKNYVRNWFECEFCKKVFKSEVIYLKHVSNHYTPIRRSTCSFCEKHFKSENYLKKHMRLVCQAGLMICKFCGKSFRSPRAWRKHLLHHLKMQKIEACKICNKEFQRKNLPTHIKLVHNKRFQCGACDKQFGTQSLLKDHEAIHSEQKPFKCQVCQRCFFTNHKLKCHKRTHLKRFLCKHCGKSFSKKCTLLYHERLHERVGPFKCGVCGRSFKLIRSLHYHKRLHSSHRDSKKTHQCNFCDKRYPSPKNLKAHITTVHHYLIKNVPKPHVCNICGKDFSFASLLLSHQAGHWNKRLKTKKENSTPFCKLCNKSFTTKNGLIAHERIHTGEKPFHCHLCGKKFRQKPHLNIHLIVHSGERPFVCDICGANYYLKVNLAHHIKLHLKNNS